MSDDPITALLSCNAGVAIVDTMKFEAAVQQAVFGSAGKFCMVAFTPSLQQASESMNACRI